jgi:phosphatidylglycerol:prolipoprotein diacylglycerol transferase
MNSSFYINIDPVILKIGPIVISWYVTMIALAAVVLVAWVILQNRQAHVLNRKTIFLGALIALVSGLIFSKLLHVVDRWSYYTQHPGLVLSAEGLTIWGAVLGGALGLWAYSRFNRQFAFAALGDMLAPGILLAEAVGRVGCTINGCCYGVVSYSPLSVIYTSPHAYAPLGVPTLPITVFEIFYVLIGFTVIMVAKGRLKVRGSLFLLYLALYGGWRLGIDFLRAGTPFILGLHEAQVVGLVVLVISLGLLATRRGPRRDDMAAGTA